MKPTARLLVVGMAMLVAWLGAGQVNDYLAIRVETRTLPDLDAGGVAETLPPLPLRIADLGGVGIYPDSATWTDSWSHNPGRFEKALVYSPPAIDPSEADRAYSQFAEYADRMADYGFNGIEMGGFIRLIDFDQVGDGRSVYAPDSPFRTRHSVERAFVAPFFELAAERGLALWFRTDMPIVSTDLEKYFDRTFGGLAVESPAFWQVYADGLRELFERFPSLAGIIVRIGEGGAVYAEGEDYRSAIAVKSIAATRLMLETLLAVADEFDRTIIFRSWTVGIGEIGRLHTSPEVYDRVLGGLPTDHLIVSTKVVAGDFWSHLPLNPTLFGGPHRRIVELQARREFETFNIVPDYVGPLYQQAVAAFARANPNLVGVWVWTQGGGPIRRGPRMIYPFTGDWIWTDANVHAAARIAAAPGEPAVTWAREWVSDRFGDDPATVEPLVDLLLASHPVLARGLSIPAFAEQAVTGMGFEIPPVLPTYWDIVDGSHALSAHVYEAVRRNPGGASGTDVLPTLKRMQRDVERAEPTMTRGREWLPAMRQSVSYEGDLIATLDRWHAFQLAFYRWLDHGNGTDLAAWRDAAEAFRTGLAEHRSRTAGDLQYRTYSFDQAERQLGQAERAPVAAWAARVLVLIGLALLIGFRRPLPPRLAAGLVAGWHLALIAVMTLADAPVTWVLTGTMSLGYLAWIVAGAERRYGTHNDFPEPLNPSMGSILTPLVLVGLLDAVPSAVRGPQLVWMLFWTSDPYRTTVFIACAGLVALHVTAVIGGATGRRRRLGALLAGLATFVAIPAAAALAFGFEPLISVMNDEVLVLPAMMSRVLGITGYLDIPTDLPQTAMAAAAVLGAAAIVVTLQGRSRRPTI